MPRIFLAVLIGLLSISSLSLSGQTTIGEQPEPLESPFATLKTHLEYLQPDNYNPERSALVIPKQGRTIKERKELAIRLKQILDGKGIYIDIHVVPEKPNYTDTTSGKHIYYLSKKEPRLYLERIDSNWYYSRSTLAAVDAMYEEVFPFGARLFQQWIPVKGKRAFLGLHAWQWIGLACWLALLAVAYFIFRSLGGVLSRFIIQRVPAFQWSVKDKRKFKHILGLWVASLCGIILLPTLQLPIAWSRYAVTGMQLTHIIFLTLLLLKITRIVIRIYTELSAKTDTHVDDQLIPIVNTFLRGAVILLGLVFILRELGVDIRAIFAGLSVGALALALAAQDTVKNFIGSITILVDAPFQIGDFIHAKDIYGTVEEIGVRSTRIRTTEQSLAYIPNGEMANIVIDNLGLRIYRRWSSELGLTYDTPPERIEAFIEAAKEKINNHEHVAEEKTLLYLNNLGASSVNIFMVVYIDVELWDKELETKHDLLLSLINLANEMDVSFAFPSTSLYVESMPPNSLK